jgi:hypothetical protein
LRTANGRVLALIAMSAMLMVTVGLGCGGGSSEPTSLTKSEFVKQANKSCLSAEEERKLHSEDLSGAGEGSLSEEEKEVTEALVAPVEAMTEELRGLGPPRDDAKEVKAIIAAFEAGIRRVEREPTGSGSVSAFAKANELALDYGLTDCTI